MKTWRTFPASCQHCGGDSEILTDPSLEEGYGYDSDELRCVECGCPGQWMVYDEDDCYADWHEEPECKCDWCKSQFDEEGNWTVNLRSKDYETSNRRT